MARDNDSITEPLENYYCPIVDSVSIFSLGLRKAPSKVGCDFLFTSSTEKAAQASGRV